MSKIRVYELAKELGKSNKEMLSILSERKIEIKNHMSTLTEDQVAQVKGAPKPAVSAPEKKASAEEVPVKKKNISQVFHPQNSRENMGRKPVNKKFDNNQNTPNSQNKPEQSESKPYNNQNRTYNKTNTTTPANNGNRTNTPGSRPAGTDNRGTNTGNRTNTQGTRPAGADNRGTNTGNRNNTTGTRPAGTDNRGANTGNRNNTQGNRPAGTDNRGTNTGYRGNTPGNRPAGTDNRGTNTGYRGNTPGARPAGTDNRGTNTGYRGNTPGARPAGTDNRGANTGNRGNAQGARPAGTDNRGANTGNRGNAQGARPGNNGANRGNNASNRPNSGSNRPNSGNRPNQRRRQQAAPKPPVQQPKEELIKNIILPESLTIKELADKMKLQPSAIVKKLFLAGTVVTLNQEIDYDTAEEIAMEFDVICEKEVKVDVIEELLKEDDENEEDMVARPPVVCVMGHVDHGKTSLLDAVRNTHVIDREAGGITQHIGAYVVKINGQKITFLDTPGHEAFTAMRMRGANSTDIAILVVAADDGVMPQTVEAINHAKAAGVEIIVAINKIDKPSANIERVKQELSEYELVAEDWGGSTIFVPVSAHTHEGIEELLEMILLTAEVCELKANPKRRARGLVIEAELDKGKGPVATILVQKGTLHIGDPIAAGSTFGKVRAMIDDKGCRVKEAGPSTPVEILGLSDVPNAGEIFVSPDSDKEARSFAETFISEGKEKLIEDTKAKMSLDDLFSQIQAGNVKELNIIVKADVQGSVEAVKQSLIKLSNEEVMVKVIHGGVGAINESDVTLASASNAIIIGFNVRPDSSAKTIAEREGVDLRLYRVIYQAIEDVEAAIKGMLDPIFEEKILGHAEVRQIFKASGIGTIAGSYVLDGTFERGCSVRITREGTQVFDGSLASLKRFKDDVKEVKTGYECGLVFEKYNEVKEFDLVEAYKMVEVPR